MGKAQWDSSKINANSKKRMMADFETGVKRRFNLSDDSEYSVILNGVEDDKQNGIEGNIITLRK